MKKFLKRLPTGAVVSIIVVLAVALTGLAAAIAYDFSNDGKVDNADVEVVMQSIVGSTQLSDEMLSLADFDGNETVDVLDVIALKRHIIKLQTVSDGWTVGIY